MSNNTLYDLRSIVLRIVSTSDEMSPSEKKDFRNILKPKELKPKELNPEEKE